MCAAWSVHHLGSNRQAGERGPRNDCGLHLSSLSVGVCHSMPYDALTGLGMDPGEKPLQSSLEAANIWFSLEDGEGTFEAFQADLLD